MTSSFFVSRLWRRVALHPVCCLCSFQVRARSSRVRGWIVFALSRSQRVYVPRISQMLITNRVNIFLIPVLLFYTYTICLICDICKHNIVSYDIRIMGNSDSDLIIQLKTQRPIFNAGEGVPKCKGVMETKQQNNTNITSVFSRKA